MWDAVGTDASYACWGVVAMVWVAGAVLGEKQHGAAWKDGERDGAARKDGERDGAARKDGERDGAARKGGRDVASLVAAGAAVAILLSPVQAWQALIAGSAWVRGPGLAVLAVATAWTVWARLVLGSMWSSGAVARRDHTLRTTGPYRVTRHPVYTGILGMLAGSALAEGLGRWIALAVVVGLLLLVKARTEERLLAAEFPVEYERYRRDVPRLVARVRPPRTAREGTAREGTAREGTARG